MANPKGNIQNLTMAGRGRRKGSKNKYTDLKQSILNAYDKTGGEKALVNWISEKPRNREIFYGQILVKVLPKDSNINLGGDIANIAERILEGRRLAQQLEHGKVIEIDNSGIKQITDNQGDISQVLQIEAEESGVS